MGLPLRRWSRGALALGLCTGAAGGVHADEFDTLNFNAGVSVIHDDNVFRLSAAADPQRLFGKPGRDDLITVTSAGLRLGKPYSLQRFEIDFNAVDYRYRNFTFLSFTALNYGATWRWSVTPRLTGTLSASRTEALNSFLDFQAFVRNIRKDESYRASALYEFDGAWRMLGGVSRIERRNSQPFIQESDNGLTSVEAGARRVFGSGSHITGTVRHGIGEFFNRAQPLAAALVDTGYRQNEVEGRLYWYVTAKTLVDARAGYVARTHANFSQRDYSGAVANVSLNWSVTGKTSVQATYASELSSFQQTSSSFARVNRVSVGPVWEVDARTVARARIDYTRRDFLGAVAATPVNGRSDEFWSAYVGADWQPQRRVTLSVSLQADKRSSNIAGVDFRAATLTAGAQLNF